MRWQWNPFFDSQARFPGPDPPVLRFHESVAGYRPTPLYSLPGLARELGIGALLVKDESQRFGLNAFKALGASWAVRRFLEPGRSDVTFAAATDGNHGRAVAWAARQAGRRAIIYVPGHTVPARIDAIRGESAEVIVVDGKYDDAVRRADEDCRTNGWQVISDTGYPGYLEIPGWVMEGYSTMFVEIDAQLDGMPAPDVVIAQAGVGGLACAAVRHFLNGKADKAVVCVQPSEADGLLESICSEDGEPHSTRASQTTMMAGLACGMPSLVAWPVLKRGVKLFLSVEDRFAAEAMRRFYFPAAADPQIISGEAGAAGLAGLLALCREEQFAEAKQRLGISPKCCVLAVNSEGDTDPVNFRRVIENLRDDRSHGANR